MSEPDVEPTVTFRAVLALIQAERDEAAARCPAWSGSTTADFVAGSYQRLGANESLGRLEVAVLRLREEAL